MSEQFSALAQAKSTLIDLAIKFGPKLVVALLILVAGFYVGRWVGGLLDRMLIKLNLDVTVRQLLVRITRLLVLVLFLVMALQNLGVELLPLIAGLGVAGAGLALAMQGVLSNLAAGFTIIFTRPFKVGEYISIANEEGTVEIDHPVFHHAQPSGLVAHRHPQSQDRRRDPAQLRRTPATGPKCVGRL